MVSRSAKEVLTARGLRATRQRIAILQAVMEERGDVTAQALHARLAARGEDLGLATVYRTLGALAASGVLDTLQHGAEACYRFCTPHHHHHLTCRACHAVIEVVDCPLEDWAAAQARSHNFAAVSHTVELVGTCAACRS